MPLLERVCGSAKKKITSRLPLRRIFLCLRLSYSGHIRLAHVKVHGTKKGKEEKKISEGEESKREDFSCTFSCIQISRLAKISTFYICTVGTDSSRPCFLSISVYALGQ